MTQSAYSSKSFGPHTGFNIDSQTRRDICNITLNNAPGIPEDERRANARRIVACVNACAGIPIEDLEAVPLEFGLMGSIERLQLHNTALLEALKDIVEQWEKQYQAAKASADRHNNSDGVGIYFDYIPYPLVPKWIETARAAIASAERSQPITIHEFTGEPDPTDLARDYNDAVANADQPTPYDP